MKQLGLDHQSVGIRMFQSIQRCFQVDILGFCSRKGEAKYVDFGSEDQGKAGAELQIKDLAWDADIDALTEMEYNLVADQPKGIKLELQEPEALDSPREYEGKESIENDEEQIGKDEQEALDLANHNDRSEALDVVSNDEMADLIEAENGKEDDKL